ncbi:ABC transporter ATP-binding protein [Limibaculum sp. M0105]|uniref:ABC transporter ATP-binding protein n=1 Tax=Thermohalobaculum xanthum TaxID=2753746 RepID=A0A8J7M8R7_9RHOB|nr:ABC transporter ATP-binding protein [Thermohalobaculum xanthum]MBK0400401.1 ABC transporter ATP-binding protein [Thermohalobaculum xanthum]
MPLNAIEVRSLVKTYAATGREPAKTALKGIDLDVPTGSIFGLLGPNGAGKSTFINILAGLVTKTSGSVRIWGFDQDVNPRQSRAAIGVVPQELNIDPFFTPFDLLEVQAGLYGVPKARRRSMEILTRVGLADKARAYPRTLSGGMRRRLLVAKAMVHEPAVLVLDEPTAGVDIELRQMMWDYVRELHAAGTTVILTTHYLEEAEAMCDRIAIINHGEVVACEETPSLLSRIDSKTLLLRLAREPGCLPEVPEGVTAELRAPDLLALRYPRSVARAPDLVAAVQAEGHEITDIETEEPRLEQVFLELTRARPTA